MAGLDSDALGALATDLLREYADPSERVLGSIGTMDDATLNDFVLFLTALNNNPSFSDLFAPADNGDGTHTLSITPTVNIPDSDNRFENGTFTQNGNSWHVVESIGNPGQGTFTIIIDTFDEGDGGGPGGGNPGGPITPPVQGPFQTLIDDDSYQDSAIIPVPDTSMLSDAMAEAFVEVLAFPPYQYIPFELNVEDGQEFQDIVNTYWDYQAANHASHWSIYLLGAHQGRIDMDTDHEKENMDEGIPAGQMGTTSPVSGGSFLYHETITDRTNDPAPTSPNPDKSVPAAVWTFENMVKDTVVHEVGHAVSRNLNEPVTKINTSNGGIVGRYTEAYLDYIRTSIKPYGD